MNVMYVVIVAVLRVGIQLGSCHTLCIYDKDILCATMHEEETLKKAAICRKYFIDDVHVDIVKLL